MVGGWWLNRSVALFVGADADGLFDRRDENLAVADLAGFGALDDRGHSRLDAVVGEHELQFDFGKEIHGVFAAAVDLRVALLAAESFDLGDGHAFDADFTEGVFHLFEFEWFDDRFDFFHACLGYGAAPNCSARSHFRAIGRTLATAMPRAGTSSSRS